MGRDYFERWSVINGYFVFNFLYYVISRIVTYLIFPCFRSTFTSEWKTKLNSNGHWNLDRICLNEICLYSYQLPDRHQLGPMSTIMARLHMFPNTFRRIPLKKFNILLRNFKWNIKIPSVCSCLMSFFKLSFICKWHSIRNNACKHIANIKWSLLSWNPFSACLYNFQRGINRI